MQPISLGHSSDIHRNLLWRVLRAPACRVRRIDASAAIQVFAGDQRHAGEHYCSG
jgi:hypothetical protein